MLILATTVLGDATALEIRSKLMIVAGVLILASFTEKVLSFKDIEAMMKHIFIVFLVAILIGNYPDLMKTTKEAFDSVRDTISPVNKWSKVYESEFKEKPSKWDFGDYFVYTCAVFVRKIGALSVGFIQWIQDFAISGLIAVSPLTLGFLALSFTRSIGTKFAILSLGVCLWGIGFALVDAILMQLAGLIIPASMLSGGVVGVIAIGAGGWPIVLGALLGLVVVSNIFYLMVPIGINALMSGGNFFTAGLAGAAAATGTVAAAGVQSGAFSAMGSGMAGAVDKFGTPMSEVASNAKGAAQGAALMAATQLGPLSSSSSVPAPSPKQEFMVRDSQGNPKDAPISAGSDSADASPAQRIQSGENFRKNLIQHSSTASDTMAVKDSMKSIS